MNAFFIIPTNVKRGGRASCSRRIRRSRSGSPRLAEIAREMGRPV